MRLQMSGKVFISCGQRGEREKKIADAVYKLIKSKLKFNCFFAPEDVEGVNDVDQIIEELRSSDYYLFIDFHRKDKEIPISLFSHQEFALAHHLGYKNLIVFCEKDMPPSEGVLKYVVHEPETFENEEELLIKIKGEIDKRGWTKSYSRNLVVTAITREGPIQYGDHIGCQWEYIWHAWVENRRPDVAAVNAVCVLDSLEFPNGEKRACYDRSYLKWALQMAGQIGYQKTILPEDSGKIDIFALHADEPGIYLHSAIDFYRIERGVKKRIPIIEANGKYTLYYKVFSEGFPLLRFAVQVNYQYSSPTGIQQAKIFWENSTEAKLPEVEIAKEDAS
jgi:hypothetical protein